MKDSNKTREQLLREVEDLRIHIARLETSGAHHEQSLARLRQMECIYRTSFTFSRDVVICLSPDRKIIEFNPPAETLYGVKKEDVLGKDYFVMFLPQDLWEAVDNYMKKVAAGIPANGFENPVHTKNGDTRLLLWKAQRVVDDNGDVIGIIAVGQDISMRKQMEERLRTISVTDDLTGLFNRRGFSTLSEKEFKLANRNRRKMSLLSVAIYGLKTINTKLGRAAADQAIIDTADILRKSLRDSDIIGRVGGDRFAVLITEAAEKNIEHIIIANIMTSLNRHNRQGMRDYTIFLSFGMAHYDPDAPCTLNELITASDNRMLAYTHPHGTGKEAGVTAGTAPAENREHVRYTVSSRYKASLDGSGTYRIKDISIGGLCLLSTKKLVPNTVYNLTISPPFHEDISPIGMVVWSSSRKENPPSKRYESGIRFMSLNAHERERLEELITTDAS